MDADRGDNVDAGLLWSESDRRMVMTVYYLTKVGAKVLVDVDYVEVREADSAEVKDGKWVFKDDVQRVPTL